MFLPTLYSAKSQLQARMKYYNDHPDVYVAEKMLTSISLDCIDYCIQDLTRREKAEKINREIDAAIARIMSEGRISVAENETG